MTSKTLKISFLVLGLFGTLMLVGAVVVGVILAGGQQGPTVRFSTSMDPAKVSGSLTIDEGSSYTPTSAYIEEGADSDITELNFKEGEGSATRPKRLPEHTVQQAIMGHQNELIQCYAEGLEEDPDLEGRVDFHFRIAPDGHVAMVKVTQSGLEDHKTEECFIKAAKSWSFPKSNTITKFDTNFEFLAG